MKLKAYLRETKEDDRTFAKRVALTVHAIRKYKNGTRIPRPKNIGKIKRATKNAVCESDWYN